MTTMAMSADEPRHGARETRVGAEGRAAEALGERLAELLPDPDAVAASVRAGLPVVIGGAAPSADRLALVRAVARGFRRATPHDPASSLLLVADRLLASTSPEERTIGCDILERTIAAEPERSWQLLRRAARSSADPAAVDPLARPYGVGILAEPYRWAELEQLVYAPSALERRLVGTTIATLVELVQEPESPAAAATAADTAAGGTSSVAGGAGILARGLALLGELIGDAQPAVQDAIAAGYRALAGVEADRVAAALDAEAKTAVRDGDGHRARVVLESLEALPGPVAERVRVGLADLAIDPASPSTSRAAAISAQFASMGLGATPAEPPPA